MSPTRLVTPGDYPTIEFGAVTGVLPPVRVEPSRAARRARAEARRKRTALLSGLAGCILLVSAVLYVWGWGG